MSHRFNHITGRVHRAYRPNFKHLDAHTFDMDLKAKVVYGCHIVRDSGGPDITTETRVYITFNRPVSPQEANDATYDMFAKGGCHHEYDCCGCWSGGAHELRRKNKSGRKWTALLSYSPNY